MLLASFFARKFMHARSLAERYDMTMLMMAMSIRAFPEIERMKTRATTEDGVWCDVVDDTS
jgi:hypothetical protein